MKFFEVKEVSNTVNANHDAWALTISAHDTREAAEEAAQAYWESLLLAEEEDGTPVCVTVYISAPAQ